VAVTTPPDAAGAVPPHNEEAEASVLGAILLTEQALDGVMLEVGLKPDDFYRPRHQMIFRAMIRLKEKAEPEAVDVVTVCDELRRDSELDKVGGDSYVHSLPTIAPAPGAFLHHARIVKEHSLLRRVLNTSREMQEQVLGHRGEARDLIERFEANLFRIGHEDGRGEMRSLEDVLHEEIDKLEELSRSDVGLTGTPSGFTDLDNLTGGFQPGNLIVLAARPSMGKCLSGGALVFDPRTGARRRMLDVVEDVERGEETWVASMGPDLKLRPSRVSAAVRNGRRPLYRLATKLGRQIDATANHPVFTLNGWRPLADISPGDRIAVPRRLPRTEAATSMPDHELVLLAALIADGYLTQQTPQFCFGPGSAMLPLVEDAVAAIGLRARVVGDGRSGRVTLSAGRGTGPNPLTATLRRHGIWGRRASNKFVPTEVFALNDEQIARFLGALFGCDGYVHVSDRLRHIGYTTISDRLARDVQHLLLRLGIVSTIRTLKRAVYEGTSTVAREVRITAQDGLVRFCQQIRIPGKEERQDLLVAGVGASRSKTNVDTVPADVWTEIRAALAPRPIRALSVGTGRPPNHNWHVGTRGLSRGRLLEVAHWLDDRRLGALATSDLWWDQVASIEPAGTAETFDVTVPGDHSFVADDIVVHNSTVATNIAENAAIEHDRPVALFSLEMSETELAHRFIASQARVSSDELRKGRVKADRWPKVLKAVEKLARAPIFVDDSSDIGVLEIRAKARRLHARNELGLIVVDYLQLVRADGRADSRVEQVGQISRGLKILARELNIPVIAVSQLSRAVESRHPPIPMLSDLRESGQVEQDADVVAFVYRDEYYTKDQSERPGEADIIIAKHRNGPVDTISLAFQPRFPKFSNLYRERGGGLGERGGGRFDPGGSGAAPERASGGNGGGAAAGEPADGGRAAAPDDDPFMGPSEDPGGGFDDDPPGDGPDPWTNGAG
jgi:replicative DNA helicase